MRRPQRPDDDKARWPTEGRRRNAGGLTAGLERSAQRLTTGVAHLEDRLRQGVEAAWPAYLQTLDTLARVMDHVAPGRRGELPTTRRWRSG